MAKKRKTNTQKISFNQSLQRPARKTVQAELSEYRKKIPAWRLNAMDVGWYVGKQNMRQGFGWDTIGKERWENLLSQLSDLESMTWAEILLATHGAKNKRKHHAIPINSFIKEARQRLDDYEEFMSLRFQGKTRLYGYMQENIFHAVWFDFEHILCPSVKSHT